MSSSVKFSEFCNHDPLNFTGMLWLVVFGDVNSLLHENQNTIIVDPGGDVHLKEVQNNRCLITCFIPITIMWEKVFIQDVSRL